MHMDHLWLDKEAQQPPEIVPVLGAVTYDKGDLWTFHERCGYDLEKLKEATFRRNDPVHQYTEWQDGQLHAFSVLQEWTFFGVLHEMGRILETNVDRADFVKYHEAAMVASTENLPAVIEAVIQPLLNKSLVYKNPDAVSKLERIFDLSDEERDDELYVARCFDDLSFMERVDIYETLDNEPKARIGKALAELSSSSRKYLTGILATSETLHSLDLRLKIWLSAILVADSIAELAHKCFSVMSEPFPPDLDDFWFHRAVANGVCPCKIFRDVRSVTEVFLASSMKVPYGEDHDSCAWTDLADCQARKTIERLPSHRKSCDHDCQLLGHDAVGYTAVRHSLDQGSYPLCKIDASTEGVLKIRVQDKINQKGEYIAFSHVWAHGLGNPSENSVPSCQAQLLHDLLLQYNETFNRATEKHVSSPLFWLDTLCVPVEAGYRRKAIRKMRETYSNAKMVIVVDKDLQAFKGHDFLRLQQLIQSDWMRRLWTYQEAVIASDLCVAFADGLFPIDSLLRLRWNCGPRDILVNFPAHRQASRTFSAMFDSVSYTARVLVSAESFHRRKTKKLQDEPICLATIMNVDTLKLPERPSLVDVFKHLEALPEDLLFTPGPRSGAVGFRWSPASFLSQFPNQYNYRTQKQGVLSAEGFHVQKSIAYVVDGVMTLDPHSDELGEYFILIGPDNEPVCILINAVASYIVRQDAERTVINDPIIVFAGFGHSDLAVILSRTKSREDVIGGHYEAFIGVGSCEAFADNIVEGRTSILNISTPTEMEVCVD